MYVQHARAVNVRSHNKTHTCMFTPSACAQMGESSQRFVGGHILSYELKSKISNKDPSFR